MRSLDSGMGAGVAVLLRDREAELLVAELLEEFEAALPADPGRGEIGGAGEIGARFLGAREAQETAHRGLLPGEQHAHRGVARAGGGGGGGEHQRQDRNLARRARAFVHADRMSAGDVAKFMRDDGLQLVGIVGGGDQARCGDRRLARPRRRR